jgi:O-antigen biosynthesis protein
MDRPTLGETLNSVQMQTYGAIEIVLVNAKGQEHSKPPHASGKFLLRLVENGQRLSRSQAANVGLVHAQGHFIVFLDDDDWIDATHIELLTHALIGNTNYKAAYSGVRLMQHPHAQESLIINEKFNLQKLMHGNFIPIHAVLFDRNLVAKGCQFDEQLDIYEDWDFWLQISRHTNFLHINQITASYRSNGESGAGPSVDESKVQTARISIYDKWRHIFNGQEINDLLIFTTHIQDSNVLAQQAQILEKTAMIDSLKEETRHTKLSLELLREEHTRHAVEMQRLLHEKEVHLNELGTLLHQMHSSFSWKITRPLRLVGILWPKLCKLTLALQPLVKSPKKIWPTIQRARQAWKTGGKSAVKRLLKQLPHEVTYSEIWNSQYKTSFTKEKISAIQARILQMESPPLISVVMPTYNTPPALLRAAIASVKSQFYKHWELCIVDDASTTADVKRVLNEEAKKDSRINFFISDKNQGIAASTNHTIGMARGEVIALLDHDDILEPQALFRLAECMIEEKPDFIYSDEVLISADGVEVVNHVHRPSFSLEYLRSCPYIVHLIAFKASFLREIGGLNVSLPISQDYDLILRAAEQAQKIVHIPEVLYQWRQHKTSTGHSRKKTVMGQSAEIIRQHLTRCGETATVESSEQFNYFDVRYALEPSNRVAIIIPTKNHGDLVRQCVESIERTVKNVAYDIVVIDHDSTDSASLAYFDELKSSHTLLKYSGPFNFSTINNWAIRQLQDNYSHYLFCNNDIEAIEEGWLERMLELAQMPDVGIVGAKLLYPDRTSIQHAGVCVGMYGIAEHYGKFMVDKMPDGTLHPGYHGTLVANHEMSAVTAACALMRKDAFDKIGGYSELLAVGFGDVDLCLQTREAGYRILFCAQAVLIHHESFTRGKSTVDPHPKDSAHFATKWRKFLDAGDPYYNPNLGLHSTMWEVKQPLSFEAMVANRVWERPTSIAQ